MISRLTVKDSPQVPYRVSTTYLTILTCSTIGLQGIWSLLLASGTPYLLSAGFSHTTTAIVWSVGPLCGTFLQPCIAAYSDRLTTRWGKRKPVIVGGTALAVFCLANLAVLRITAEKTYKTLGPEWFSSKSIHAFSSWLAIFWLCVLNVSLQPIQIGIRAFVVEACPPHQQHEASAWTGRFTALGSIITYLLDSVVIEIYPRRSFEVLCLITSVNLVVAIMPSLWLITEDKHPKADEPFKVTRLFKTVRKTARRMSPTMRHICFVQFASWLGWFPFLYYNTSYVSRVAGSNSESAGVKAYFLFALVTLVFSIVLPWFRPSADSMTMRWPDKKASFFKRNPFTSLRGLWCFSQLFFAGCMLCTMFVSNTVTAIAVIALSGISWSLSLWVPLAMMSVEIAQARSAALDDEIAGNEHQTRTETAVLMSIYNIAISLPQILAAVICGAVFMILEGATDIDPLGWVLRIGGAASLVAAALTLLLKPG